MFTLQAGKQHAIAPTIPARTKGGGGLRTDFDCDGGLIAKWPAEIAPTLNAQFGDKQGLEDQHALNGAGLFVAHSLRADGFDASEDGTGRGTPLVPVAFEWQRGATQNLDLLENQSPALIKSQTPAIAFSAKDHGADAGEIAPTLRSGGHDKSHANGGVMPAVAFALGSHAGAADGDQTNRSHAAGGPVGSNISEECAYSLRGGRTQSVAHQTAVRRLTPRECERLQGFPDDYTLVTYRGKPAADGPRYKSLGHSFAVPVVRWIGQRIQMVEDLCSLAKPAK
jgi:DNA (cytosine-5)-methyltransferase 1